MSRAKVNSPSVFDILRLLPKNSVSRIVGRLARCTRPAFLVKGVIKAFADTYDINLDECQRPLSEYASLVDFFTRELIDGARPLGAGIVSPADGMIVNMNSYSAGSLIQAKGMTYSVNSFLGDDRLAEQFSEGQCITVYLSPRDYHLVHSPADSVVKRARYIPGNLWPVNSWSVNNISSLFSVNERVVLDMETNGVPYLLVMVGATNVGSMRLFVEAPGESDSMRTYTTNRGSWLAGRTMVERNFTQPVKVSKGEKLGVFELGSTVIMLWPKEGVKFNSSLANKWVAVRSSLGEL